jgi:hypothetical protein
MGYAPVNFVLQNVNQLEWDAALVDILRNISRESTRRSPGGSQVVHKSIGQWLDASICQRRLAWLGSSFPCPSQGIYSLLALQRWSTPHSRRFLRSHAVWSSPVSTSNFLVLVSSNLTEKPPTILRINGREFQSPQMGPVGFSMFHHNDWDAPGHNLGVSEWRGPRWWRTSLYPIFEECHFFDLFLQSKQNQ